MKAKVEQWRCQFCEAKNPLDRIHCWKCDAKNPNATEEDIKRAIHIELTKWVY